MKYRHEKDSLGVVKVPEGVYYGPQTQRAIENFPISGLRLQPSFIKAYGMIKVASASVHMDSGRLDIKIGRPIQQAALEVVEGKWNDQFVVDVYQAGAGTSQNMNTNEVIANRALEIMKASKGDYSTINPNDHVNMGQSTNDTFHVAMRMAALESVKLLLEALNTLHEALEKKSKEFKDVVKSGRTHLQDAVPITLGQEFSGYAAKIKSNHHRVTLQAEELTYLLIGGTAVGTGINTEPNYAHNMIKEFSRLSGFNFKSAPNCFELMQNTDAIVALSGALKTLSVGLTKLCHDLRLLSSGPNTGLGEISLPPLQPGSSMMPGKVNPVAAEMLNMVCFQVSGNDVTIGEAAQAAQLELNVMMPVIAYNILHSLEVLKNAMAVFTTKCVEGIEAHPDQCLMYLERNPVIAIALTPYIGYEEVAAVVREAYCTHKSIKEVVIAKKLLSEEEIKKIFDCSKVPQP